MTTAQEIMHRDAECIGESETLTDAARRMRDLGVGALPICGDDNRLQGIITDRDIVIRCLAEGKDPATTRARELSQGRPFYIDASADIDEVLHQMMDHKVTRLPVIENNQLVGMISESDLARNLPEEKLGQLVEAIKSGPADRSS
ncbi:CBS domain-containing protein [Protofrankia symbiont of Coriaria ruscifolia]|uniref:CBS domain-containing protein n=1 Tax=Protofrankia symbiont of Coriaria ruscifolia TaxID=1306542 RepID=UPI0010419D34|nr:CBS domain-containing protein [Protofrankia symbiont of Coriaria ruscifolia]